MIFIIITVIIFGFIKIGKRLNSCYDWFIKCPALFKLLFIILRFFFLFLVVIKNYAPVLWTYIISLPGLK